MSARQVDFARIVERYRARAREAIAAERKPVVVPEVVVPEPVEDRGVWTREKIAELTALWAEGLPTVEVARRMAMTKNQVVGKAHRLGLPPRQNPVEAVIPSEPRHEATPVAPIAPEPRKRERGCLYMAGDDYATCGKPVVAGKPYCPHHTELCYVRPRPARDVPPGSSWAFRHHRTMADVLRDEAKP